MATPTKTPKPKWFKTIAQAFTFVRKNDSIFLPAFLIMSVLIIGTGVTLGFMGGSVTSHIYSNLTAVLFLVLGTLILLTRRVDPAQYNVLEGTMGGSLGAVRTIRRGWQFEDDPVEVDPKGRAVVFLGVGKSGIALIAEGGGFARRPVKSARARLSRIVPGVPIQEYYAGLGEGELSLRKLVKAIKGSKKVLKKRERAAIVARIHSLGGARLPIPKGIDPMRVRPDRKALRGR